MQDAGPGHAVPPHPQQVARLGTKEIRRQIHMIFNVLFGEHGLPGRHAPDHRQPRLFRQANAPRGAGRHFQSALAGQRLDMLLGGIGRAEAKHFGDLRPGGGIASALDVLLDDLQHLGLPRGQIVHDAQVPRCVNIQNSGIVSSLTHVATPPNQPAAAFQRQSARSLAKRMEHEEVDWASTVLLTTISLKVAAGWSGDRGSGQGVRNAHFASRRR